MKIVLSRPPPVAFRILGNRILRVSKIHKTQLTLTMIFVDDLYCFRRYTNGNKDYRNCDSNLSFINIHSTGGFAIQPGIDRRGGAIPLSCRYEIVVSAGVRCGCQDHAIDEAALDFLWTS